MRICPSSELTHNYGVDGYELGTAYGHVALTVDDLDVTLEHLKEMGIEPEKPLSNPRGRLTRLCFVRDPDDYRIELLELGAEGAPFGRCWIESTLPPHRVNEDAASQRRHPPLALSGTLRRFLLYFCFCFHAKGAARGGPREQSITAAQRTRCGRPNLAWSR